MTVGKASLYFFIFLSLLTCSLSLLPGNNGDLPYYIATALTKDGKTDLQALSETKTIIYNEVDGSKKGALLSQLETAEKNILDYYRIKPLYILIINFLHHAGFSFVASTIIPSLLSFFGIGCLVFLWCIKICKPWPSLIFSVILLLINPCIILARLSSPDALSNIFIFYCLYRIYFGKSYYWTALILMTSLFIRLDNFISVFVLLTLMQVRYRKPNQMHPGMYVAFMILTVFIGISINVLFEPKFWWFLRVTYIQSAVAYGLQVLIYFLSVSQSFLPCLILIWFVVFFTTGNTIPKMTVYILASIVSIIFLRFIFFPSFEERFMTAYYLTAFLVLLERLVSGKNIQEPVPAKK
jgi:hypothetical protein